jgi:hypothetical protein
LVAAMESVRKGNIKIKFGEVIESIQITIEVTISAVSILEMYPPH